MEVSGKRSDHLENTVGKSSAEEGEIFCEPCSSDGDWVVAKGYCQNCNEYFCAACLKPHRKQSATRHHIILEGDNMPKATPKIQQVQVDDTEPCSDVCEKHASEIVKFFCSSHDAIGCSDCMVLEHKACKVERIQDISMTYFDSPEHRELVERVEQFYGDLEELKTSMLYSEEDINKTYTKAIADIQAFRKEVNEYLDKSEAEIMAEISKRKQQDDNTVSLILHDTETMQNTIKEMEEKLKLQSKKANELFVAARQMKDMVATFDSNIRQMFEEGKILPYWFEPSPDTELLLTSKAPLGKLTENLEPKNCRKKIEDMEPQFDGEIYIKLPEDSFECFITASALISPRQIILADNMNMCVKLVDTEQKTLITRYKFSSKPVDVAVVSGNLIAVTIPDNKEIHFLSIIHDDTLTKIHVIKTNGFVRKITCQDDTLIIGYNDNIEILNLNGEVQKKISSSNLTWIASMASSPDSIFYVSNNVSKNKPTAIYKFDFDGNLLATYKNENLPQVTGLTMTPDGTLLVCNLADKPSIHVVSSECKKIKEILQCNENAKRPFSLSFCDKTNKLFLCNYKYNYPKQSNVLNIFQLM